MFKIGPRRKLEDLTTATNLRYVGVSTAGSGCSADVFYALPASVLTGSQQLADVATLRSQVCAVKLFKKYTAGYFSTELAAIKRLSAVPEYLRAYFTEPLEYSEETDNSWYAMKAVNGFTLAQLRDAANASSKIIPEELIFHIYIELHEALEYLHQSDPPMIKGDLIGINVMVDPTVRDNRGFPSIKLIDFGAAKIENPLAKGASEAERHWMYRLVCELATTSHTCSLTDIPLFSNQRGSASTTPCVHGTEFDDFVAALKNATSFSNWTREQAQVDLRERLPKILTVKRAFMSSENREAMEKMLVDARESSRDKFPTDQQILDAVNGIASDAGG